MIQEEEGLQQPSDVGVVVKEETCWQLVVQEARFQRYKVKENIKWVEEESMCQFVEDIVQVNDPGGVEKLSRQVSGCIFCCLVGMDRSPDGDIPVVAAMIDFIADGVSHVGSHVISRGNGEGGHGRGDAGEVFGAADVH